MDPVVIEGLTTLQDVLAHTRLGDKDWTLLAEALGDPDIADLTVIGSVDVAGFRDARARAILFFNIARAKCGLPPAEVGHKPPATTAPR